MRVEVLYTDLTDDDREHMLNGCGPQRRWYDVPQFWFEPA